MFCIEVEESKTGVYKVLREDSFTPCMTIKYMYSPVHVRENAQCGMY